MALVMDDSSTPIQSGEDLAAEYANWKKATRPEWLAPINAFVGSLDVDALHAAATREMGSECTNAYHIGTGGFNAVYFLTFLDGREAIARTNREVQTDDQILLRDRLLSESRKPNPVGARFLIEERILGLQLSLRGCTPAQRKTVLTKIFHCEAEFIRMRFTSIGSIYHRPEDDLFYVGPIGPSVCRPMSHTIDRGPWTCSRDWLKAYVKSELAWIQDDPAGYRESREVKYKLEDKGNAPLAYHVAWLETLLETIDKLRYLRDIPAAVERPVLYHEDLSGGNILVSYPDPTVLAGLIDFEGARVIPLWAAMAGSDCANLDNPAETEMMKKVRLEILCQADPACEQAEVYRQSLRFLRWLVSMGVTMWCSVETLHQDYAKMKDAWPVEEPAFAVLDELVALGPAGYT